MKTWRAPAIILTVLYLAFFAYLISTSGQVPPRVATHFNSHGQPNGWMSRSGYFRFIGIFGFCFPLLIVGVVNAGRLAPSALNIPRKQFWLAPERRQQTFSYLSRQALWFGCIAVVFMLGLQFTLVQANAESPVQLSMPLHFSLAASFFAAILSWMFVIVWHFYRAPT